MVIFKFSNLQIITLCAVACSAEGFVGVGLAEENSLLGGYESVADIGEVAAADADGVGLIDIIGYRHERGHRSEGLPLEVHVEPCDDDAHAAVSQLIAHVHDTHVEELRLVDADHIAVVGKEEDVLTGIDGRRGDDVVVVADHILLGVTHIDGGFEDFYFLFGKLCPFHTADEFFGLAGEHASAHDLHATSAHGRSFGISFGKHNISLRSVISNSRFAL